MAGSTVMDTNKWLQSSIASSKFLIFSKTTCPFCIKLKKKLTEEEIRHAVIEVDKRANTTEIQQSLSEISGIKSVPQVFVRGKFQGGCDDVLKKIETGELKEAINKSEYDYDMLIIGGGSGGLAASKEAARFGAKVAVLDFVEPTPQGTKWGLGGTCVNVGCIPKKLMHNAAILSHHIEDAPNYGWNLPKKADHDWGKMVEEIQNYIHSLNWGYRVALRSNAVNYINAMGHVQDKHTVKAVSADGKEKTITAETIVLATGERPKYPDIPGAKEYCLTSDDLFSLTYNPGKTLIVGASYVALECAGFLKAFGNETQIMVRSILLRGFDQQMADMAGKYMADHGMVFHKCLPSKVVELEKPDKEKGKPGLYKVTGKFNTGEPFEDTFNTVLFAIGRDPCTSRLFADGLDVQKDKAGRIICDDAERSSVPNIYAIGDIVSGKPQLTPVAIKAGVNLARRLYAGSTELTDYEKVATTVFTPLEYGCIGLAEEDAIAKYGARNIEVYHSFFTPLEWTVAHRENNVCYAKVICNKADNERIVGFHVLCPNAGEVTQGFAIGFKMGACKSDLDGVVGIHPTVAEIFTTLKVTKSSGVSAEVTGC